MARKRLEAWAWSRPQDYGVSLGTAFDSEDAARRQTPYMHLSNGFRLVHLVESRPEDRAVAAVVRAAVGHESYPTVTSWKRLVEAVARYLKAKEARYKKNKSRR